MLLRRQSFINNLKKLAKKNLFLGTWRSEENAGSLGAQISAPNDGPKDLLWLGSPTPLCQRLFEKKRYDRFFLFSFYLPSILVVLESLVLKS